MKISVWIASLFLAVGVQGQPSPCLNGKIFNECGTACPTTCENRFDEDLLCITLCVEGCFCPEGTVELGDGCVAPNECPLPGVTCATVLCLPGFSCSDSRAGAQCLPIDVGCDTVNCSPGWTCLETSLGPQCFPNEFTTEQLTCATVLCLPGFSCSDTRVGPQCLPNPLTCATVLCAPGFTCQETGPQCVADDGPALTCATVLCLPGFTCTETRSGPECLPNPLTCATVLCAPGFSCSDTELGPQCLPDELPEITCANVLCAPGFSCSETRAGPQCLPDDITCATVLCAPGFQCMDSDTGPQCVPICTNGKEYNDCGSACPATCENGGNPGPCLAVCVEGCFCPEGTVELGDDECVPLDQCPPSITCANVLCAPNTPFCIETDNGPMCVAQTCAQVTCFPDATCAMGVNNFPECIPNVPPPSPLPEPVWFSELEDLFPGIMRLKRCIQRDDQQPTNGDPCAVRPKTCYFRTQDCNNGTPFPMTECICDGSGGTQTWTCTFIECPPP